MNLLTAAAIPVVAFLYVIYQKDTIKEPIGLLAKCFIGGCLSILLTLVIIYFLFPEIQFAHPAMNAFYEAFFQAAIPEELAKFIILYWLVWNSKEFDQHYDGIIYAVFVSIGFAFVENVLYVFQYGYGVAVLRGILAVPGHGLCGVCMGYFFSLARFDKDYKHKRYLTYGIVSAIILHGLYDFFLMYMDADGVSDRLMYLLFILFVIVVIVEWHLGIKSIRKHLQRDKNTLYQQVMEERIRREERPVQAEAQQSSSQPEDLTELEGNEEYHKRFIPPSEDENDINNRTKPL